jgi:hypothetical protein
MDGAETLNALAAKKDLTLSDLNVFAETANQQAALLAKWITTFNSYDLEFIDTFSPQKDRVTLAKFYDRINELQINGRSTEALERMWLALNVLHTYLDNQLVPRLQEVVRVNDAAHTASAQIIEKVSQQRSSDQKEILDLRQQVGNQEATIRFYQEKTGNLNDKIELLQV